jgi:hypothetical protein
LSLSVSDAGRLKDLILEALKTQLKITDASPEEQLFCYCIDFFNLQRP